MFSTIPEEIRVRMAELEEADRQDRIDGTAHGKRLRQVPPVTGRFLALMAVMAPPGPMLELGTSAGYSAMWLSLACRQRRSKLVTCEILPARIALARETIRHAGIGDVVELVQGDGLLTLRSCESLSFCFWDTDKDRAQAYYKEAVARLVPGGLFISDNAISHQERMSDMLKTAFSDQRVDAMVVPIGKGLLLVRRQRAARP
jgi:caffeoyl-CoA O-methyltransferase